MAETSILAPSPYDDVFRTLVVECIGLVIPLINEMCNEHYHGEEDIQLAPNEHFINRKHSGEDKRITDSNVLILGEKKKRYHLECESTPGDSSILIRIFEYDAQIALDQGSELFPDKLVVSFPQTAILYLRSTSSTKDRLRIVMKTPGGETSYTVPVMKVKDYSLDEIFDKELYFLIPFYIFTYESRFAKIENSGQLLEALKTEYEEIKERLEQLEQSGRISTFYKVTILDMSNRVLQNIALNYEKIRKGLGTIMGGQVLDYEAKILKDQFLEKGRLEGRIQERIDMYRNEDHLSDEEIICRIMAKFDLSEEAAKRYVLEPVFV